MKNIIKILLLLMICTANMCEKKEDSENCHFAIKFSNNTTKNLRVKSAYHSVHHPEPLDITRLSYTAMGEMYKINSNEQDNRSAMKIRGCIEKVFKREGYTDTVFVYIFDAELIENTPWEVIARDYLVLKRYDLTLEDLNSLNWNIPYPPDERMKNMKMWPPYGQ